MFLVVHIRIELLDFDGDRYVAELKLIVRDCGVTLRKTPKRESAFIAELLEEAFCFSQHGNTIGCLTDLVMRCGRLATGRNAAAGC